jgi:pimeloyl-ACP methyl ester carboxylesterase
MRPDTDLVVYADTGHFVLEERPEAATATLREFLAA